MSDMINELKKGASENAATDAVFHLFASRQRARETITLRSLAVKMRREGFTFAKEDYIPALQLMAKNGIGQLDITSRGRIRGLKGIKVGLPSLGKAICGTEAVSVKLQKKNHFDSVKLQNTPKTVIPYVGNLPNKEDTIDLEVRVRGLPVSIKIHNTREDLSSAIEILQKLAK